MTCSYCVTPGQKASGPHKWFLYADDAVAYAKERATVTGHEHIVWLVESPLGRTERYATIYPPIQETNHD